MFRKITLASTMAVALGACAAIGPQPSAAPTLYNAPTKQARQTFGDLTYRAVEHLMASQSNPVRSGDQILVASVVNVDNLDTSSSFGRIIAEQAASRLTQLGYSVTEVRLRRGAIKMSPREGQLALSRQPQEVQGTAAAKAIVTGSYAVGGNNIYVTLHLVSPSSAEILSAVDFVAPLNSDTRPMVSAARR